MKYKITKIVPSGTTLNVYYTLSDGKVVLKEDFILIPSESIANLPSDGREDFINQTVKDNCKKYMVISDVKDDFSSLIDVEVSLDPVIYKTVAEQEAKLNPIEPMVG